MTKNLKNIVGNINSSNQLELNFSDCEIEIKNNDYSIMELPNASSNFPSTSNEIDCKNVSSIEEKPVINISDYFHKKLIKDIIENTPSY